MGNVDTRNPVFTQILYDLDQVVRIGFRKG